MTPEANRLAAAIADVAETFTQFEDAARLSPSRSGRPHHAQVTVDTSGIGIAFGDIEFSLPLQTSPDDLAMLLNVAQRVRTQPQATT
jgi:hypothetical protein